MSEKEIAVIVVSSISALAGGFFLWLAFQEARAAWRLVRVSLKATGTVRGFNQEPLRGHTYHYPRIEFTTQDGAVVRFASGSGTRHPAYTVDAPVPVRYDPALPQEARIDSFGELWLHPILVAFLGSLFCGATAFLCWLGFGAV